MTTAALAMVDQVLAGYGEYAHYFAVERYYTTGLTGPAVVVYLSSADVIMTSAMAVSVGSGVRVECYTSTTASLGTVRMAAYNQSAGNISWGVQELVLSDCRPTLIGGVKYDLPASYIHQANQANVAAAMASTAVVLLLVFVLVAEFWRIFRWR